MLQHSSLCTWTGVWLLWPPVGEQTWWYASSRLSLWEECQLPPWSPGAWAAMGKSGCTNTTRLERTWVDTLVGVLSSVQPSIHPCQGTRHDQPSWIPPSDFSQHRADCEKHPTEPFPNSWLKILRDKNGGWYWPLSIGVACCAAVDNWASYWVSGVLTWKAQAVFPPRGISLYSFLEWLL